MKSRRQEKVARIIKESVSDCIANHLSDPRIEGLISVTEVDISPDLRNVDVFISIMAATEAIQNKTFNAIIHATKRIQSFMAKNLDMRFCPVLHIKQDDKIKKTLETMKLIEKAVSQYGVTQNDEEDSDDSLDSENETFIDETDES